MPGDSLSSTSNRIWQQIRDRPSGPPVQLLVSERDPALCFEWPTEECGWLEIPGLRTAAEAGWRIKWNMHGLIREVPSEVLGNLFRTYDDWRARSRSRPQDAIPREALILRWEQTVRSPDVRAPGDGSRDRAGSRKAK